MKNFRLVVVYRGDAFCGWQKQKRPPRPSVQEVLENACSEMFQRPVAVTGAGRTDAGVHSLGQVASFRVDTGIGPESIRRGLNRLLPEGARVSGVEEVPDDFHPRYQAREKTYRYLAQDGETPHPLLRSFVHFVPGRLDLERMRRSAERLVGRHDFAAFQGSGRRAADTVRTILEIRVEETAETLLGASRLVALYFRGDGYLFRMARNLAGTLLEAGLRRTGPVEISAVLASGDRRKAGPTAPAHGLTLMEVKY